MAAYSKIHYKLGYSVTTEDTAFRLLDNSEALERGGRKLNIGQRLLAETEGVGAAVLADLSRQRETMQHARAKVIDWLTF